MAKLSRYFYGEPLPEIPPGTGITVGTPRAFRNTDNFIKMMMDSIVIMRCCRDWPIPTFPPGGPGRCKLCGDIPHPIEDQDGDRG